MFIVCKNTITFPNLQITKKKQHGKGLYDCTCENYDISDGNRTVLTVEGTYTSGDREGITVSHEIDFGTMQIKRNYLYKVRIALEDPAGDTYGKVTHAINVKDWTSGVTLAWAGDENLYNNAVAANFTVTETAEKLRDATISEPERHLVIPFNAEKSATFYVTSTSTKSGLSLTCPAISVAATAEELALNTSADNYQCKIEPLPEQYVYNEDGTFIQKWKVTVRESAILAGNILTFTLQNALNSALSTTFEIIGAPFRNSTSDIQAGDVYYANGLWSRSSDFEECSVLATPIGIIAPLSAKVSDDPRLSDSYCAKLYNNIGLGDIYYSAGFWSPNSPSATTSCNALSTAIGVVVYKNANTSVGDKMTEKDQKSPMIGGHALIVSMNNASSSAVWGGSNYNEPDGIVNGYGSYPLFPTVTTFADMKNDFAGYNKTRYLTDPITGCKHGDHQAAELAKNYHTNNLATESVQYFDTSTAWFLLSVGQWIELAYSYDVSVPETSGTWASGTKQTVINTYITAAGGEIIPSGTGIKCSSENSQTASFYIDWYNTSTGFRWLQNHAKSTNSYSVRPFLAI